ncbi:MAG: hypothetical protein AAF355_08990 [Myxococcota bacterium]
MKVLEQASEPAAKTSRPRWFRPIVTIFVVTALGGGYVLWSTQAPDQVSGEVPSRPLRSAELLGFLNANQANEPKLAEFFASKESLQEFASQATHKGESDTDRIRSFANKIRTQAQAGAFRTWSLYTPRDTTFMNPAEVLEVLNAKDTARIKLYPLELALFGTVGLRQIGIDAMVVEILDYEGARRPPDPSGHFGYFGIAVPTSERSLEIIDPYRGSQSSPSGDSLRVLTDTQVLAAVRGHQAMYQLVHEGNGQTALDHVETALRLDPQSPAIRTVHAYVLIEAGNAPLGFEELETALRIRADAPRRNNMASMLLQPPNTDLERAQRLIGKALESHPDYAGAHANLAAIHLSKQEYGQAYSELQAAEQLDPSLLPLPLLFAQYHASLGEIEEASRRALQAIERAPHHWRTRLLAAKVLRFAGDYDGMRAQALEIMNLVPSGQKEAVRQTIRQLLGPTAFDTPQSDDDSDLIPADLTAARLPEPSFQLGGGSRLLGAPAETQTPPFGSLLDSDAPDSELLLGSPAGLKLREPGQDFQLDLR